MFILHIETATPTCSIALSNGPELLVYLDLEGGMNHTGLLAPSIQELLHSISIKPADLGAIAVSSGPGSYTGLRVGSSTAKAMAYTLGIPILAVPTLSSLANALLISNPEADFALPMIDARRMEVYTTLVDRKGKEIWPVSSIILNEQFFSETLPEKSQVVSGGDGALKIGELAGHLGNFLVKKEILSSARHMVDPAWSLFKEGKTQDALHYVPQYLKPPNITTPRQAG